MDRRAKFKRAKASRQAKQDAKNIRALCRAIWNEDLALVQTCFKKITAKDIQKNATLILSYAIQAAHASDDRKILTFLLEQNLDITDDGLYKAWEVTYWTARGQETIFRWLLNTNRLTFDPDSKKRHRTFFIKAIEEGHIETIKRTLANLDVAWTNLYTPPKEYMPDFSIIDWAIMSYKTEVAELLLDFYQTYKKILYADERLYNDQRIFYCAVRHNDVKIAQRFVDSPSVQLDQQIPDPSGLIDCKSENTAALYYPMRNKNQDMFNLLLNAGATLGRYAYTDEQLKVINPFEKPILAAYNNRLKCLRESLESNRLPSDVIKEVVSYAAPPELPTRKPTP